MSDALIAVRGDLSDITEKFSQLKGQLQALDSQAAAPAAAAVSERFKGVGSSISTVGKTTEAVAGKISEKFKHIGVSIAGVGVTTGVIGGAVASFGVSAARDAGKTAEMFELLHQKTGIASDDLRGLLPIFNRFNTNLSALESPFRLLSKNFEDAAAGSGKALAKFKALGIEISSTDKPIDVLRKIADAAQRIGPGFERNAEMAQLMGRGIGALVPILAEGSAGLVKSADDAQRMGLMLSAVTENQLKDMDDAFDDVGTAMKAFHDTVGTAFAPVLLQMAQALTSVLGEFNRWFQGLDDGTKQLVVVFTGAFAIGGPILVAIGGAVAAIALISAPLLVTGAIIVGIIAGVALILLNWDKLKTLGTAIWTGLTDTIVGAARSIHDGVMEWLVNKTAAIAAKVQRVAQSIAKPFEWLADHLVGHSVIPDMVNDIGRHMQLLDTRMGSPARIATANTLKAFTGMQLGVRQMMGQLASVTVSTWGNVTNTISAALSKNLVQGNNWAQTWTSIQETVLSSFINMALQMATQWGISEFARLTTSLTTNAVIVTSNAVSGTASVSIWGGASAAIVGFFGTVGGGFAAIAGSLIATVIAVGTFVMTVLGAIASALTATVFGIPFAGAILVGIAAIAIALVASKKLPKFGDGGMVFGPTLALVGEKGPEIIAPLDKVPGLGKGGGSQTIVIQLDGREIARSTLKQMPGIVYMKTGLA